jgi:hypothetical protein
MLRYQFVKFDSYRGTADLLINKLKRINLEIRLKAFLIILSKNESITQISKIQVEGF